MLFFCGKKFWAVKILARKIASKKMFLGRKKIQAEKSLKQNKKMERRFWAIIDLKDIDLWFSESFCSAHYMWIKNYPHMTRCKINDHFKNCSKLFEDKIPQGSRNIRKSAKVVTMSIEGGRGVPPVPRFWG